MTLNKAKLAIEAVVLLGLFVAIEWLAHSLTNTRRMFVPALVFWAIYLVVRVTIAARRT